MTPDPKRSVISSRDPWNVNEKCVFSPAPISDTEHSPSGDDVIGHVTSVADDAASRIRRVSGSAVSTQWLRRFMSPFCV